MFDSAILSLNDVVSQEQKLSLMSSLHLIGLDFIPMNFFHQVSNTNLILALQEFIALGHDLQDISCVLNILTEKYQSIEDYSVLEPKTVIQQVMRSQLIQYVLTQQPQINKIQLSDLATRINFLADYSVELMRVIRSFDNHRLLSIPNIRLLMIAILISPKNSQKAITIISIFDNRDIRLSEFQANIILQKGIHFSVLADFLENLDENIGSMLTEDMVYKIFDYFDWAQLAQALHFFVQQHMPDRFWNNIESFLQTSNKNDLDELINHIISQPGESEDLDDVMPHLSTRVLRHHLHFRSSDHLLPSQKNEAQQECLNKGTVYSLRSLKKIYYSNVDTQEKANDTQRHFQQWYNTLSVQEHKIAIKKTVQSVNAFSCYHLSKIEGLSLKQFFMLCWLALNDESQYEPGVVQKDAYDYFMTVLADVTEPLCYIGWFNKLNEALAPIHKQVLQSGQTLSLLTGRYPYVVTQVVYDFLKSIDSKQEACLLYEQIKHRGPSFLWSHISAEITEKIQQEFNELIFEPQAQKRLEELRQCLDDIIINFDDFEPLPKTAAVKCK